MRKLVESTYISLDGMVSGGDFWGAQGQYRDDKHVAYAAKLMEPAEALVLGRATYEVFAESWPGQTGDLADRINSLPKYVASRTLTDATWNAEILQGDAVEAVARLKESGKGTLLKYGTGSFSQALLEGGELDELHLWVFPFIAGSGEALLPGITTTHLDLADVTELGNDCVVLTYTPKQ
jgi:dihydrofolate reductase